MIIDLTAKSPAEYRVRTRPASEVRAIVLHQTAFSGWHADNPMWTKVRAHFVVRQDGSVLMLHDPLVRMRFGSGVCNAHGITIEHEGNLPSDTGAYWKPEKYGRDVLAHHPEQVAAARSLVRMLVERWPTITTVIAHRHIDARKANCPGPDLWREVGQWSVDQLELTEATPLAAGLALPDSWRGAPRL